MKHGGVSWSLLTALVFSACSGKTLSTVGVLNEGEAGIGLGGEPNVSGAGGKPSAGSGGKPISVGGGDEGKTPGGSEAAGGEPAQPLDACNDNVKNGSESDVDCGGGECEPCFERWHSNGGHDCQSGQCGGPFDNETCEPSHCGDHLLDFDEGDVDCGGADCHRCEPGSRCTAERDCLDNSCQDGFCVLPCQS